MARKHTTIACVIFLAFMAAVSIIYFIKGDTQKGVYGFASFLCGLIPLIIAYFSKLKVRLPLTLSYLAFLFASQYLGSILKFYSLGWWDLFLHLLSGVLLAYTGMTLYLHLVPEKIRVEMPAKFLFLFILSFPPFGGVLWEIYEFSMDTFAKTELQFGGNTDTMTDLIADTLGGLIIAILTAVQASKQRNIIGIKSSPEEGRHTHL
ncbi:hypothetical protein LRR81_13440 [Metabacillus sp. GX 13764]|uniref:hypothetical protein n=1 Tax=Metabacillus kandeliae TaxID=2900151 RepID=UPI001E65BACB|nr:hypothetical protein [Metabacillus kandeliae]MCD7035245.1 hypothetical protein [Metabacillus kandeliae]